MLRRLCPCLGRNRAARACLRRSATRGSVAHRGELLELVKLAPNVTKHRLSGCALLLLLDDFPLHPLSLEPHASHLQLKLLGRLLVLRQLLIHIANLLANLRRHLILRRDLPLQLLDFVVEDELELFELLVLLPKLKNACVLFFDCLLALCKLLIMTLNVVLERLHHSVAIALDLLALLQMLAL